MIRAEELRITNVESMDTGLLFIAQCNDEAIKDSRSQRIGSKTYFFKLRNRNFYLSFLYLASKFLISQVRVSFFESVLARHLNTAFLYLIGLSFEGLSPVSFFFFLLDFLNESLYRQSLKKITLTKTKQKTKNSCSNLDVILSFNRNEKNRQC